MSSIVNQPSRNQVLAAARRKWGKNAIVHYNPAALTAEQRAESAAKRNALRDRLTEIAVDLKRFDPDTIHSRLLNAAAFVTDVDGDDPSIPQLREVVVVAKKIESLRDEQRSASAEFRKLGSMTSSRRWQASEVREDIPGFPVHLVHCYADTAQELLNLIER